MRAGSGNVCCRARFFFSAQVESCWCGGCACGRAGSQSALIRIGNEHPDRLITYPDAHNLSACAQPIRIMPRRWGCGSWRCLQIVVWLGLATRSKESAGVEGAGGTGRPGCGARGRWRGLAGLRDDAQAHVSTPGPTGVEGAGGSGGHGRASRSTTPSRRLACGDLAGGRARRRPEHQRSHTATTRGMDGERAGRPRGGRRSVGGTSDNSRIYSPARRSTSCMMRPHTALTHATAATPRTRERQGRICRKSSKP